MKKLEILTTDISRREDVYEKILALSGKESEARPETTVWVPAVANGGLKLLLEELEARGWRIYPPTDSPES